MTPPPKPTCSVCAKPCAPSDRNSDGTYAHADCLRLVMTR